MRLIDISTKKHPKTFCIVDDSDYEFLSQWKWSAEQAKNKIYAVRSNKIGDKRRTMRMHNQITGIKNIDHIDGDGLNNQRGNLRKCTHMQNMANTPKRYGKHRYKGIAWQEHLQHWTSRIVSNKKRYNLGCFPTAELAAAAYNFAAKRLNGEFAWINPGIEINEDEVMAARFSKKGNREKPIVPIVPPAYS
ncbi:MAG TPA: AP2 domain-containing protein [Ramlibacter sp.]|nr:AP2 domain-containing protein [Ramlibacter sp.]